MIENRFQSGEVVWFIGDRTLSSIRLVPIVRSPHWIFSQEPGIDTLFICSRVKPAALIRTEELRYCGHLAWKGDAGTLVDWDDCTANPAEIAPGDCVAVKSTVINGRAQWGVVVWMDSPTPKNTLWVMLSEGPIWVVQPSELRVGRTR